MKTFVVHHRSPHHAVNSGYSRLIDYISEIDLVTGNIKFPYQLARLLTLGMRQDVGFYDSSSLLKELELYKLLREHKKEAKIIHYLNAERDIRHLVQWKRFFKNAVFCGTFHKPTEMLKEHFTSPANLKQLDGAIAVGSNQVDFLKDWLGISNIQYIPHGVDTQFFKPAVKKTDEQRILFVGQHLRDFETFNKTIKEILNAFPNVKVDIVLHKAYKRRIEQHASINIKSNINDLELRNSYQKATLLFLPLLNVTACNSILEGLACGVPIVTTNVGGNPVYLKGSKNILVPKQDTDACLEVIFKLLNDDDRLYSIGESSRLKAMEYDWKIVSNKVVEFYKELHK